MSDDRPLHTVVETARYLRDCDNEGVPPEDRARIVDAVAAEPGAGDPVKGSGGVLKRRFAGRGKGKSGGYRAMIAYVGERAPVFLLALLGKGAKAAFSDDEVAKMKTAIKALKAEYERD